MSALKISILGNSYETNYPTVGQCIDIKRLELTLSGNRMSQLLSSGSLEDSEIALDIKAVAVMSILFPKLKEELKANSFLDLQYDDWMEILKVFNQEVFPWFVDWKKKVRGLDVEQELKKNDSTGTEA